MNTNSFEYYLKDSGLARRTIEENVKDIKRFEQWAIQENYTDIAHLNYNELLNFVQYLKGKGLSVSTVNIRICSIRKYYDHLKEEGIIETNPAKRLFIKGTVKRVVKDILNYTELESLYNQYLQYLDNKSALTEKHEQNKERNKVVLGLMVWQGVHSGELKKMETTHVHLNEGIVYISGTRRSNGRELKLSVAQVIPLHAYLNSLPQTQTKLFECNAHNIVTRITDELKGINPIIKNAQHIRASVIFHWLKMYDKRQVQYMIGHKCISSTERYEQQTLEGLTDLLTKHHPFS